MRPTSKHFRKPELAALALGVSLAAAASCGGSREESATPLGTPTLEIATPGEGACVEIGRDPAGTVIVEATVGNWTLRPPEGCTVATQCGFLVLFVDPTDAEDDVPEASSASPTLSVELGRLGIGPGSHTFRVELRNDDGSEASIPDGGPILRAEVTVDVRQPFGCNGGQPDAGSDAGDASMMTEGGTDASVDAGDDAAADASDDADPMTDASPDATLDAATDSGAEAGMDATLMTDAGDASVDAGDARDAGDAGDAGDAATD